MDAIRLLKDDHKAVEQLFKRFEKAGDGAYVEKRQIVDRIIESLSKHAAIEEQLFYPVSRATVPDTDDVVLESLEEHHVVKWLLSELDTMPAEHERFDAKVNVLMENVRHHVEEEEQEFFPKVRDELGRNALNDLGDAMEAADRGRRRTRLTRSWAAATLPWATPLTVSPMRSAAPATVPTTRLPGGVDGERGCGWVGAISRAAAMDSPRSARSLRPRASRTLGK